MNFPLTNSNIFIKQIQLKDIVFEDRVKLKCFFCDNYGIKETCPPRIPDLDYQEILAEYSNFRLVFYKCFFRVIISNKDRLQSTKALHHFLLGAEEILWKRNFPLALSFIGGCCKLCSSCKSKCLTPTKRRIPLEALGINVVKTVSTTDVKIVFPPKDHFYRVGLLIW